MNVLVINTGSSSLKFQLLDMRNETVLAKGLCDRIGLEHAFLKLTRTSGQVVVIERDIYNHKIAMQEVINLLTDKKRGVISSMDEISAVGHRVVHGGEKFHDSVVINEDVMSAIQECAEIAPLHNPPNIVGIKACQQLLPGKPMVAVFDTAFHQTLPDYAYIYALPYEIYEKYKLWKYGFHGTSHRFVSHRAAEIMGRPIEELKLISCHLGNGASICAVDKGKSVDTSMGYTPLQGLAMGTRSGTIDPSVISFLMEKERMNLNDIKDFLNKKSGILGVSGVSSDFRDVQLAAAEGNERAKLAIDIFSYRVKRYIGDYASIMNGVDAVIFTAGIGENNELVRRKILENLDFFGIKIDWDKNKVKGQELDISASDAKVKTLVVPTNEELAIARETAQLLKV